MLFAAPPGYVPRCSTAAGPVSRPTGAPKDRYSIASRRCIASRPMEGRGPAQRAAAATEATAGGSRSAARPGADHEDPPTTAPRAPPACLAHAHRLARLLPGAGRSSPYQPHECQLAIPPQRERGSGLIPNCAGHQAVDYSRGAPRRRSLKLPRRPRLPATSRQGARRGAHRRPPHTSHHRQTVPSSLGERTHPARKLITLIPGG